MRTIIASLLLMPALVQAAAEIAPLYIETESGQLRGHTRIAHATADAQPRAWVTGFEEMGDGLDLTLTAPTEGDYQLQITYFADSDKFIPVSINGNLQGSRRMPRIDGFNRRTFGRVHLDKSDNLLSIDTDWGYVTIDAVSLTPLPPPERFQLRDDPVTPHASPEARALPSVNRKIRPPHLHRATRVRSASQAVPDRSGHPTDRRHRPDHSGAGLAILLGHVEPI